MLIFIKVTNCCTLFISINDDEHITIDEDFQPSSTSLGIESTSDEELQQAMLQLIEECSSQEPNESECNTIHHHLKTVLNFRCLLHGFFREYADLNSYCLRQFTSHQLKEVDYEEAMTTGSAHIQKLLSSANDLLAPLTEIKSALDAKDSDSLALDKVFSLPLVRLSQANPLRYIPFLSLTDAVTHLSDIILNLIQLLNTMLRCFLDFKTLSYEYLLHFSIDCSRKQHHLLHRSLLAAMLHAFRPIAPNLLRVSMLTRGVPGSILASPTTSVWTESSLAHVAWETLKGFCVHRNTIIVKLDMILPKWGFLSREAHMVDKAMQVEHNMEGFQCHAYWTMLIISLLMDATMANMFECELIAAAELDYFFW